jgi:hypothetical protein
VTGDPQDGKVGPVAQFAAATWAFNRGDKLSMQVHEHAVGLGDAFVIVEWDPLLERVRMHFNAPELVRVWYDAEDPEKVTMASKQWVVGNSPLATVDDRNQSVRLNVYYEDRVERYIRNGTIGGGNWRRFTDDAHPEWPIWWTETGEAGGAPLGVPVVHFANSARAGQWGRSEIADVIPLQDALNKAVVDAVRVMDAMGWPQRYATGIADAPSDDLLASPGSFWYSSSSDASFGQLDEAGADGILALWNKFEESVASVTRTPQHLFRVTGGDMPSGEALKTAENGLVSKAIKRAIVFGDAWEDVMTIAHRIARANGQDVGELPDSGFAVEWENPETRGDELQHIQAINAKQGISRRQRWREYGYTDEQIERMEAELADEPNVLEEALAAFDAGAGASEELRGRPVRDRRPVE